MTSRYAERCSILAVCLSESRRCFTAHFPGRSCMAGGWPSSVPEGQTREGVATAALLAEKVLEAQIEPPVRAACGSCSLVSVLCTAVKNNRETSLYLGAVAVDGRGTAFVRTSCILLKNGIAFSTSGSW